MISQKFGGIRDSCVGSAERERERRGSAQMRLFRSDLEASWLWRLWFLFRWGEMEDSEKLCSVLPEVTFPMSDCDHARCNVVQREVEENFASCSETTKTKCEPTSNLSLAPDLLAGQVQRGVPLLRRQDCSDNAVQRQTNLQRVVRGRSIVCLCVQNCAVCWTERVRTQSLRRGYVVLLFSVVVEDRRLRDPYNNKTVTAQSTFLASVHAYMPGSDHCCLDKAASVTCDRENPFGNTDWNRTCKKKIISLPHPPASCRRLCDPSQDKWVPSHVPFQLLHAWVHSTRSASPRVRNNDELQHPFRNWQAAQPPGFHRITADNRRNESRFT